MLDSKRNQQFSVQVMLVVDAVIIYLSFFIASLFRDYIKNMDTVGYGMKEISWLLFIAVPFTPLLLELFGFYRNALTKKIFSAFKQMFRAVVTLTALFGGTIIIFQVPIGSRMIVVLGMLIGMTAIFVRFLFTQKLLRKRYRGGKKSEKVIIAGTLGDIEDLLDSMPNSVTDFWSIVTKFDLEREEVITLDKLLADNSVKRVIFASKHTIFQQLSDAVEICEAQGVEVWMSAGFIRSQISRPAFDTLGGSPMLVLKSTPELSWELLIKSAIDRIGALIIILLSSPFWLFAFIGIKIASPGPVFFKQDRAGKYGESFKMWKFRTMVMDAEAKLAEVKAQQGNEMDGPVFKLEDDPRVFKFARLLRKLSIDELPQLINVLLGDMSLVGPRPLPVYEVEEFSKSTYRRRMSVKPGITCTWQVGGRNSITNFDDWIALDLEYIDNWTLWYDIKILLKTVPAVLFGSGAK